jgi:glycine/D-amino acid oxidase-like deaminating enzyme
MNMIAPPVRALPRSLYAETAQPGVAAPPLDGEARADVVVVGGGFTGLSAALHLAERGVSVAVLESHEIGWGASGRNGGQVNPGLKFDPDEIESTFGKDLGGRMVAFSGAAPQTVFDLIERHQIVCEASRGGTIRAAKSRRFADTIRRSAETWQASGAPTRLLDRAGMQAATGTDRYLCGMIDPRGGNLNPLGYARGLARAAQQAGARIHAASPALRMEKLAAGWRIATPGGGITAPRLALCTNGYTDDLLPGLKRSVLPVFSMIAATEPLPAPLAEAIMPTRSVLFEVASMTVYYRLDQWNRLLMGGRSPSRETHDRRRYQYLMDYTLKLWPALRGVAWTHFWNGQLAISTDHYPHFHEPAPGVIAALAYNGRGVAMATAMGTQIAARILGASQDALSMPITDMKTVPFHGLWKTAVSARIVYGRLRDSLGL